MPFPYHHLPYAIRVPVPPCLPCSTGRLSLLLEHAKSGHLRNTCWHRMGWITKAPERSNLSLPTLKKQWETEATHRNLASRRPQGKPIPGYKSLREWGQHEKTSFNTRWALTISRGNSERRVLELSTANRGLRSSSPAPCGQRVPETSQGRDQQGSSRQKVTTVSRV